ncbi:rplM [Symbiodinium natans]|uniref:N-acetylgalactosaminide beta-1,3-galactosyltransferase n=1 Tax=Symbiodinium natans TaxID=878477 RepID=A0A812TV86_9DINO|nr:rplM [Symbiodinium natans]
MEHPLDDSGQTLDDDIADPSLWHWANMTADETCGAVCRINTGIRNRGSWWEAVEQATDQVCWGCDLEPWPNERAYGHEIWTVLHDGLPIRRVAAYTNLWSVPCPRGIQHRHRGTRCLIGHFVYGIMCFFKFMGEGRENVALTSLESVMDLAFIVHHAPCRSQWAFPVEEVAENYERILTDVWHRHLPVPDRWLRASSPLRCWRRRAPEPQEASARNLESPRIQCLVLTMYPRELERMAMIVETYAKYCDSLQFVIAGSGPSFFRGYQIVNLRQFFDIAADPQPTESFREPNTIEKTFMALNFAGLHLRQLPEERKPHVICRLDSDTLFLPPNLRRILACRNFSSADPWAIGFDNYAHKHQQPGRVFLNGGTGVCLSRAALEVLSKEISAGKLMRSSSPGDWNTGHCVTAPGHWDDVVLGACLAQLGVSFSRWGTDCEGRSLFWPDGLQYAFPGPGQIRPRRLPPKGSFFQPPSSEGKRLPGTDRQPEVSNYHFWLYRVWQHLACSPPIWLGDFPVSFHPYRNRTLGRRHFAYFQRKVQLQVERFKDLLKRFPERIIMRAVWGMMKKTKANRRIFKERLKLFAGPNHLYYNKDPVEYPMHKIKDCTHTSNLRYRDRQLIYQKNLKPREEVVQAYAQKRKDAATLKKYRAFLKKQLLTLGPEAVEDMSMEDFVEEATKRQVRDVFTKTEGDELPKEKKEKLFYETWLPKKKYSANKNRRKGVNHFAPDLIWKQPKEEDGK